MRALPISTALGDWPGIARTIFLRHVIVISAFALLLALTVKLVRYQLLKREHTAWSSGTVRAGIPGEAILDRRRSSGGQDRFVVPPKERRRQF